MAAPKVWLKANHCLKGKDVLPVALRLRALYGTSPPDLPSLSKKYSLESYSKEELATEFKHLIPSSLLKRNICGVPVHSSMSTLYQKKASLLINEVNSDASSGKYSYNKNTTRCCWRAGAWEGR